jgi:hypothetical protein
MKKKLTLNKETLRYLKDNQLGGVAGGASEAASSCYTQCCGTMTCGCGPNYQSVGCTPRSGASTGITYCGC